MPIKIPDDLPAFAALEAEGVIVMRETDAIRQDIRPLRIGLLNLMPDKIRTETQIARLLGATPLQIELSLIRMTDHIPRNASKSHMGSFYRPWSEAQRDKFDGFIITGAPVEKLDFTDVSYWTELRRIFDWTQTHVHATFYICWAAQAGMHYFHGTPKHILPRKTFGVFPHRNLAPTSRYLRGFPDHFNIPVSRWTEIRLEDIPASSELTILMQSPESGLCLIEDRRHRSLFMFDHLEYDTLSLADEYFRDISNGEPVAMPLRYFPEDDVSRAPDNEWRAQAHLLFSNWINEIYQSVPFDLDAIGRGNAD